MFVAEDATGKRIELLSHESAAQFKASGEQALCPGCHTPLILKNGQQLPAHFAHQRKADCWMSEPESAEHLRGKMLLLRIAESSGWRAQLEVPVREMEQRIDVLLTRGRQQLALEFQCSPLSANKLYERTAGYARLGMQTQWFLGNKYLRSKKGAGRLKFALLTGDGLTLRYLDTVHERLITDSQINADSSMRRCVWPQLLGVRRVGYNRNPLAAAQRLARALQYGDRNALLVQKTCYLQGCNLAGCPWPVHTDLINYAGLVDREELLRVRWLLQFAGRDVSDHANALFWSRAVDPRKLPLVSTQAYSRIVAATFTTSLQKHAYLQRIGGGWRWLCAPQWYDDVEQKVQHYRPDM